MINNIELLLQSVAIIQKKYEDLAELSGENFNVFDILGVNGDELSHSAIIANLLNAQGKHGQKDVFLRLFIEQIKTKFYGGKQDALDGFTTQGSRAETEKYIGKVDNEKVEGGRVDIVISSGEAHIVIENKIYAGDQEKQLIRYRNKYPTAPIIYLTLEGDEPTTGSQGNLTLNEDFICVSYSYDIITWLEKCVKEVVNKPFIRETLNQYIILLKTITNQSTSDSMQEEIEKLITEHNAASIEALYKGLNTISVNIKERFFNEINSKLKIRKINLKSGKSSEFHISEDGDGVFVGLSHPDGETQNDNPEIVKRLEKILVNDSRTYHFNSGNYLFWYNPKGFKRGYRFMNIETWERVKMYKENDAFEGLVNPIIEEANSIIKKVAKEFT